MIPFGESGSTAAGWRVAPYRSSEGTRPSGHRCPMCGQSGNRQRAELRPVQDSVSALDQGSSPEILRCYCCHQPCIRSLHTDHDLFSELPFFRKGGRALNQKNDRLSPTTGLAGLPCMRASGAGWAASRSFQYSRTANFRAMASGDKLTLIVHIGYASNCQ